MRNQLVLVGSIVLVSTACAPGCATQRCLQSYEPMTAAQAVRRDGEILTSLVEQRRAAAQALQEMGEQSSSSDDLQRSIQAWEMSMALVVQLQNLSRREENAERLAEHRELTSRIRCLAGEWAARTTHIIGANEGMRMLGYQRELEAAFGSEGRPTDSQLSAIAEGREIYMGPVEEEVDVPEAEEGTGPSEAGAEGEGEGEGEGGAPAEGGPGEEGAGESGEEGDLDAAVDDLLGE